MIVSPIVHNNTGHDVSASTMGVVLQIAYEQDTEGGGYKATGQKGNHTWELPTDGAGVIDIYSVTMDGTAKIVDVLEVGPEPSDGLLAQHRFQTHDEARAVVFAWIEIYYNRQRRHSALGYMAPAVYEQTVTTPTPGAA